MDRLPLRQFSRVWSIYTHHSPAISNRYEIINIRNFSQRSKQGEEPKGFFARVLENIKTEYTQNKDIKESLQKFRQETQKLEDTEAIRKAREKFKTVEAESMKDVNEVLQNAKDSLKSGFDKAKEAEFVKKTMDIGDKISSKAKDAAQGISKQGEYLKETTAYRKISEASQAVEQELDDADVLSSIYRAPTKLLKRSELSTMATGAADRVVAPNEHVQSVELHKDSRWSQSWKKFKEDNPYINKAFEFKMKYDESDNPLVRVTRSFVDKISDTIGGILQPTDLSNVMTEICKVDPNFDINVFLKDCEKIIIPTILESLFQRKMDVLTDWCHEAVFNVLCESHKKSDQLKYTIHSQIIDLSPVELVLGKLMDQGPVLVVSIQAQQLIYVTDSKGNVVEGDKDKVVQNNYVMAFCRDQSDLDPKTAWRLIDCASQQSQFMF